MGERVVSVIPRVLFFTATWKPIEYGLCLTDKRSILFVLREPDPWVRLALGSAMALLMGDEKYQDLRNVSPEYASSLSDSIVIPHEALQDLKFKPSSEYYKMFVKYATTNGKSKKQTFAVAPPLEHMKNKKHEGYKKEQVLKQYAAFVQESYRKALPPRTAQTVKWSQ